MATRIGHLLNGLMMLPPIAGAILWAVIYTTNRFGEDEGAIKTLQADHRALVAVVADLAHRDELEALRRDQHEDEMQKQMSQIAVLIGQATTHLEMLDKALAGRR